MDTVGVIFVVACAIIGLFVTVILLAKRHNDRPSRSHKAWVRQHR